MEEGHKDLTASLGVGKGRGELRGLGPGAQAALLLVVGVSLEMKGGHGKKCLATEKASKTRICLSGPRPERAD